jgi:hypothetical protein
MVAKVPPKRQFLEDLQGTTTQKKEFFIVPALKTPNPSWEILWGLKEHCSRLFSPFIELSITNHHSTIAREP